MYLMCVVPHLKSSTELLTIPAQLFKKMKQCKFHGCQYFAISFSRITARINTVYQAKIKFLWSVLSAKTAHS